MKSKDYDKDGNRITPFRSIHKSIRRGYENIKDHNGFYKLVKVKEKNK